MSIQHTTELTNLAMLLAETRMGEVSLHYREQVSSGGTGLHWWFALIPLWAVGLAFMIHKVINRPSASFNLPHAMLCELYRAHRVNARGRRLLNRIAEKADLTQPASMLLGIAQFEAAIAKAGQSIRYSRSQQATLNDLRQRLFAE